MATETFFQKEKRLKNRKPTLTATYKKGLFLLDKEKLCAQIMQPDVVIRAHATGELDDGTQFIKISIEGYTDK